MSEKATGYALLVIGICVMLLAVAQVLFVFTGRFQPISLFNLENPKIPLQSLLPSGLPGSSQMPALDILPPGLLNKTLNLSTNFFLMMFVLTFGYKLASLGVMLVHPVVVKMKEASSTKS